MKFQLEVQKIENSCLFKLAWGKGQKISATLPYSITLLPLYEDWRKAYLNYYQRNLRAKVPKPKNEWGKIRITQDWHRQLVQSEARLLSEFHCWLRQEQLYEIRSTITKVDNTPIYLYLTCSRELERLPWESWEIETKSGLDVAIYRNPTNIRAETPEKKVNYGNKPRILAIIGDDTGLDLNEDRETLNSLHKVAEIILVTWKSQQTSEVIKTQIQQALTDEKGWSMLFFAGHSNETTITGGEIAIAPGVILSISEIARELTIAKNNGLQFALFNSCSGLSIAKSAIDLGLSQVIIMREPIHNRVAQVFLSQFLKALGDYQNVGNAWQTARDYLKKKQNLTDPSAYLIPSLFCHPEAQLFQIQPRRWREQMQRWLPTKIQAIAMSSLCLLGVLPSVQNFLLDKRMLVQSVYRDATGQIPATKPPVTLVHLDEESLRKAGIDRPVPMNRAYLAALLDRLATKNSKIVGIDYLFDRVQPNNDPIIARSIENAVKEKQTWFIFGAIRQINGGEIGVTSDTGIGDSRWTLQGYTDGLPNYLTLPASDNCGLPSAALRERACPFAYLLAMVKTIEDKATNEKPQPSLDDRSALRERVDDYAKRESVFLRQTKLSPITGFSQYFAQQWLRPVQDFSLPPDLVYDRLSAWQLLEDETINTLEDKVVIIGSGGYSEAGLTMGSDNFAVPTAIAYWRTRRGLNRTEATFTGSEILAYMTHHLIEERLVIPIPELWLLAIAFLLAKGIDLSLEKRNYRAKWLLIILSSTTVVYGLLGLQLYISNAIVIPWLLPSVAIWTYLLPIIDRKSHV